MSGRLNFTIDEADEDRHARAVCQTCLEVRYLTRPLLREIAPGQTLAKVEQRVRCIARPWADKRGKACGGRMRIEFYRKAQAISTNTSTVTLTASLASFESRREQS